MKKLAIYSGLFLLLASSAEAFAQSQISDQEIADRIGMVVGGIIGVGFAIYIVRRFRS